MTDRRTVLPIAGAVLVVLLAGAALTRCGTTSNSDTTPSDGTEPTQSGTAVIERVEVRAPRPDEATATEAAVAYTQATQRWLYLTDDEIEAEINQVATPRAAPALIKEVTARVGDARVGLSGSEGPVWWIVRPLATKTTMATDEQARVAVWTVTVLSATGVAVPQAEWVTTEVDLEWRNGRWLIDSVRDTAGPTPLPAQGDDPWDGLDFDEALDGFVRLDGEPIP